MSRTRPYVDRGIPGTLRFQGGELLAVKEPPPTQQVILTLSALRRHNSLEPALQPTNRILLRWGEGGGSGLPDHDAEVRETHYDPLPSDLQEKVDAIIDASPWETLTRKWYRTSRDRVALAKELRISRRQLYADWHSALWYYRGRFESARVHG